MRATVPERFMLVYFPELHPEGTVMPEWFQHMTILPWMQGDYALTLGKIANAGRQVRPIHAQIAGTEMLGPKRTVPVWLLEPKDKLTALHRTMLAATADSSEFIVDKEYLDDEYLPHITPKPWQPGREIGEQFTIGRVSVVGWFGEQRIIDKHFDLNDE